jgi:hypothetical protein
MKKGGGVDRRDRMVSVTAAGDKITQAADLAP